MEKKMCPKMTSIKITFLWHLIFPWKKIVGNRTKDFDASIILTHHFFKAQLTFPDVKCWQKVLVLVLLFQTIFSIVTASHFLARYFEPFSAREKHSMVFISLFSFLFHFPYIGICSFSILMALDMTNATVKAHFIFLAAKNCSSLSSSQLLLSRVPDEPSREWLFLYREVDF